MRRADFERFYDRHIDRVYRYVFFRVSQNVDVAEDLTSEIFMKALKAFHSYDPDKSQVAWIMTIARNHVINHYRDRKEIVDVDEVAFKLEGSDGRDELVKTDEQMMIQEGLSQLTLEERTLVEMKHLQGYRYKEIGEVVGKSPGAVRVQVHRAMKKLQTILEQRYETPEHTTEEIEA